MSERRTPLLEGDCGPLSGWMGPQPVAVGQRDQAVLPDLFFLRHCPSEWNQAHWYQGQSDPPLSESGISEAKCLAEELASVLNFRFTLVSSPLARARMTAAIIASRVKASVVIDERLMELGYGMWEGHSQEAVKRLWPAMLRQWKRAPDCVVFPGGESLHELQARVKSFLADVVQTQGPVLAVTHDGVIRVAALEALGLPLSAYRKIRTTTGSLVAFVRRGSGITVAARHASTSHARSDLGEAAYDAAHEASDV